MHFGGNKPLLLPVLEPVKSRIHKTAMIPLHPLIQPLLLNHSNTVLMNYDQESLGGFAGINRRMLEGIRKIRQCTRKSIRGYPPAWIKQS